MNPITLIVCVSGLCFNPGQITYMAPQGNIIGNCRVHFARGDDTTIDSTCEELAEQINRQLIEKSVK